MLCRATHAGVAHEPRAPTRAAGKACWKCLRRFSWRKRSRYRRIPGNWAQFKLLFRRAGVKWVRGWGYKFIDLLLFVTAALVIGAPHMERGMPSIRSSMQRSRGWRWRLSQGAWEACGGWAGRGALLAAGAVHGTAWELERVRGNVTLAMLTLAIISVVASLGVFGKDRLVFWRESSSGQRPPGPAPPPARPTPPAMHMMQAMCTFYKWVDMGKVASSIMPFLLDERERWTKATHSLGHAAYDASLGVGGSAAVLTSGGGVLPGLRTSAYFLGHAGLNLIDITVQPAIFMSLYYTLTLPEINFLNYYVGEWAPCLLGYTISPPRTSLRCTARFNTPCPALLPERQRNQEVLVTAVAWMVAWYASGLGYWASVAMAPQNSMVAAATCIMILGGFLNGVDPRFRSLSPFMKHVIGEPAPPPPPPPTEELPRAWE